MADVLIRGAAAVSAHYRPINHSRFNGSLFGMKDAHLRTTSNPWVSMLARIDDLLQDSDSRLHNRHRFPAATRILTNARAQLIQMNLEAQAATSDESAIDAAAAMVVAAHKAADEAAGQPLRIIYTLHKRMNLTAETVVSVAAQH